MVHHEDLKDQLWLYNDMAKEGISQMSFLLLNTTLLITILLFSTINNIVSVKLPSAQVFSKEDVINFKTFLSNEVKDLRSNIQSPLSLDPPVYRCTTFYPILLADLFDLLPKMKPSFPSEIFCSVLLGAFHTVVPFLISIVNCSLLQRCVPLYFKQAVIHLLLKKPNLDSSLPKSFRPIP